jgi:ribulose-phosphate 3-epimerase
LPCTTFGSLPPFAADFGRLAEEVTAVERASADLIHIDVMDGHFVPNLTLGPPVIEALRRVTKLPLDVHLMIEEPERWVDAYAKAGADILACPSRGLSAPSSRRAADPSCGDAGGGGLKSGDAAASARLRARGAVDSLVMSVNPGFGGQSFIPSALGKIAALRRMISERGLSDVVSISVDGGIKLDNAAEVVEAGATVLVSGSGIFATPDYTRPSPRCALAEPALCIGTARSETAGGPGFLARRWRPVLANFACLIRVMYALAHVS